MPTEVERPSVVAGYGPPWTMDWQTSTPVGYWLTINRPALSSRAATKSPQSAKSSSVPNRLAVNCPSIPAMILLHSSRPENSTRSVAGPKTSSANSGLARNFSPVVRKTAVPTLQFPAPASAL